MAFFDQLGNLTPDQNQALLSAASQILQSSGPSRTPTSIGQILGGGLQAYQQGLTDAEQRRLLRQQQQQQGQLLGLKIQDAQSDLANQAAARDRAARLQQFYQGRANPNPAAQLAPGQTANLAPTLENAQALTPKQAVGAANDLFSQRIAEAQALRAQGFGPEADAAELQALKFQPKVKDIKEVQIGGRTQYLPIFEDGTQGKPVQYDAAVKLAFQNTGGQTVGLNPFTGQQVAALTNTASPESLISSATARRGQDISAATAIRGQDLTNARALAAEKAPTEFQGKSAAFGLRANEANKTLNDLQGQYSPAAINSKLSVSNTPLIGGILGAATNKALSEKDQQAEQAQRDFVNAILRQESGAAIGASEFDNARQQYFPQPGDSAPVIAQKARNRALAVQALQANAGKAKLSAPAAASSNGWSIQRVGE